MKRILLGTTTLVGAAALFAGAAVAAETPKVTIGGFADFQLGVIDQDLDTGLRDHSFRSDTEISFRIDGKLDNGLGYGGGIDLEADVDGDSDSTNFVGGADSDNQGFNASRTFVYLEGSNWGRAQMGSDLGVTNTMKVDASSIARATGGIDGDFKYYLTATGAAHAEQYIATPDLLMDYGILGGVAAAGGIFQQFGDESTENNNKITYYTPRFSGFQLGVSYIVDSTASRGQLVSLSELNNSANAENIWQGAISWEGKFDQVGIALAATGEVGDAEACATTAGACTAGTTIFEDLAAWNVGGKVTFSGFSFAASYGDWGDSLRLKSLTSNDDADYWTLGAAYEMGPFAASVTYLDSNYEAGATAGSDDFQNLSIGVDYKLAPGFTPYAEVSFVEADAAGTLAAGNNDATVFIAGTLLNF